MEVDTRDAGLILGREDLPSKEGTATHSSILAWRIPWTEVGYRQWVLNFVLPPEDAEHSPMFFSHKLLEGSFEG